jgi:protein-ribulosamine 3-kinase
MMDNLPDSVRNWCSQSSYGAITSYRPVGGGCINNGARLLLSSGKTLFLKTNQHAPQDMFAREAEGLKALATKDGPRVPAVFLFERDFILLEDMSPSVKGGEYWASFGRKLAAMHNHISNRFGFEHANYIGSTPQPNPWTVDGYDFFGKSRLLFQAKLAEKNGLLDGKDVQRVEKLVTRLRELVPEQPASLIHGDLWSGNAITDSKGQPVIIDPATHFGWGEAELGMTALFGGFPDEFYRAYQEVRPLNPGWKERLQIYNLYHLLNHLNLFGTGYYGQVNTILQRYG